jgi:predicted XRE-type DNA-binding protein
VSTAADPIPALKQQLGAELARALAGWRASDVCELLRTDPARVSNLRRGRLERFSLETLIRYCTRLGRRVDLVINSPRFDEGR